MKKTLDARNWDCPKPVIEAQKALKEPEITELVVHIGNMTARENLKRFAQTGGYDYSVTDNSDGSFTISIQKEAWTSEQAVIPQVKEKKKTPYGKTYLITSERLGQGAEELGQVLMKGFLYTLTQTEPYPKKILLLNSAIHLSTTNEETVEHLKRLNELGTQIYSCGTCLNFYEKAEKLKVGEIGNMYDVVEALSSNETITIG